MGDRKLIQYVDELTDKEKLMVKKVLENYNFSIIDITKVRSSYKIDTNIRTVCLKRVKHNKTKTLNSNYLAEELNKNNFPYTSKFFKTKDNYLFAKHKKMYFYVVEWIDGDECDLNDIDEACDCVRLLAKFHISSQHIDTKVLKIKNNLKNWPRIFKKDLEDLEKFKKYIEKKRLRNEFDKLYKSYLEGFYNMGSMCLQVLNTSDYYVLSKKANEQKLVCHDSFDYQNIIKKDDTYYIVNLDTILINLHINDLSKFIRRLMFKKEYQWDFEKAKIMIEAYDSVNKLSKSEIEAMLSMIIFPHKFCRLGKKRYIKHKDWSENKYIRKLNKLLRYNEAQQKFLNDYLDYLGTFNDLKENID
ncbi:CotS family spore coat protein [Clostridium peptidivorans]|uniref:CotS family spore coat protein n=1 Tax=Clostridium peptidivorans TaxID=100174 RepID=UPI000BE25E56|nr:CotS family spore coat protein [Clostridium peptidivorans]